MGGAEPAATSKYLPFRPEDQMADNLKDLAKLREKLVKHRRYVVGLINSAANIDGDAIAKVALIVAIQDGLAAIKAAHDDEVRLGDAPVFDVW
jgi:hypothetical protein